MDFSFKSKLWEWQGQGAWCFISLPKKYYDDIKAVSSFPKKGFGSVKVEARIGKTTWKTSIFPDAKTKTYLLPIKKEVRKSQGIEKGDTVSVNLRLTEI